MSIPITQSCIIIPTLLLLLLSLYFIPSISGLESTKLDQTGSSDPTIKCGGCSPCGHPSCYSSPPPPPPPPPKKRSTTPYCPPPPLPPSSSGGFVYITAPPGDLYPVDPNYSGSTRIFAALINLFLGFGLLIVRA